MNDVLNVFIFTDHITSPTSIVMPIETIIDICHKHGAVVLVDGAHAIGQIPLNMKTIGADVYICKCACDKIA